MKIIPILILSFFLSGCAFDKFFERTDTKGANINPEVLTYCDQLKEDVKLEINGEIKVFSDMAEQYVACAKKQAAGVKVIKELIK